MGGVNRNWHWITVKGWYAMNQNLTKPIVGHLNIFIPSKGDFEYAVSIRIWEIRPSNYGFPGYHTILLLMVRLHFWRSGDHGILLRCYYSQVHYLSEQFYQLGSHSWPQKICSELSVFYMNLSNSSGHEITPFSCSVRSLKYPSTIQVYLTIPP